MQIWCISGRVCTQSVVRCVQIRDVGLCGAVDVWPALGQTNHTQLSQWKHHAFMAPAAIKMTLPPQTSFTWGFMAAKCHLLYGYVDNACVWKYLVFNRWRTLRKRYSFQCTADRSRSCQEDWRRDWWPFLLSGRTITEGRLRDFWWIALKCFPVDWD